MTQAPDPTAAEQALAIAERQRQHVVEASREPWWVWLAGFVVVFAIWASIDLGDGAHQVALLLATALLLVWTYAPKASPRIASALGRRVIGHRSLVPLRTRLIMVGIGVISSIIAVTAGGYSSRLLIRFGAPAWATQHPHIAVGALVAAFVMGAGLAVDRVLRRRIGGSRLRRDPGRSPDRSPTSRQER